MGPATGPSPSPSPSLTLSPPGRTRPKKEDWLKKKDRKQRRPGRRRKKTRRKRGDRLESHSDPLTDTTTTPDDIQTTSAAAKQLIGHEGQRTLRPPTFGWFSSGRSPVSTQQPFFNSDNKRF